MSDPCRATRLATAPFDQSGRRDLNPRPPEPHAVLEGTELRHRLAITRGPGRRCRNSGPEDRPGVVRNSQQNSQQDGGRLLQEGELSLLNNAAYPRPWCKFFRSGSDFVWTIPEFR